MSLEALFQAAREDGPTEDRKKATWNEIAAATGAATVAVAAKSSVGAKALALKIFLVSAFVVSVSGAVFVASGGDEDARATPAPPRAMPAVGAESTHVSIALPNRIVAMPDDAPAAVPVVLTPVEVQEEESDLSTETRLVTEARAALVRGDAATAMSLVQRTKKLKARSLEPEELNLEARAARILGRTDDAQAAELLLKSRYPSHALAH